MVFNPAITSLPLLKSRTVAFVFWFIEILRIAAGNCSGSYIVWICLVVWVLVTSFSRSMGSFSAVVATMFWIVEGCMILVLIPALLRRFARY